MPVVRRALRSRCWQAGGLCKVGLVPMAWAGGDGAGLGVVLGTRSLCLQGQAAERCHRHDGSLRHAWMRLGCEAQVLQGRDKVMAELANTCKAGRRCKDRTLKHANCWTAGSPVRWSELSPF